MKQDLQPREFRCESSLGIYLHMQGLIKEYERIVSSTQMVSVKDRYTLENRNALDRIKLKIENCEEGLRIIEEIF